MKTKTALTVIVFLLTLLSCREKGVIFKEYQDLSENIQWNRSDKRTFVIPVEDNSKPYQFGLTFRYATGFRFGNMMLRITETDPEGKKTITDVDLRVRDDKGEFIGEAGYDIIDLDHVLDPAKKFPVLGNYTYQLEHTMASDPVHYAMEVGLVLKEIIP